MSYRDRRGYVEQEQDERGLGEYLEVPDEEDFDDNPTHRRSRKHGSSGRKSRRGSSGSRGKGILSEIVQYGKDLGQAAMENPVLAVATGGIIIRTAADVISKHPETMESTKRRIRDTAHKFGDVLSGGTSRPSSHYRKESTDADAHEDDADSYRGKDPVDPWDSERLADPERRAWWDRDVRDRRRSRGMATDADRSPSPSEDFDPPRSALKGSREKERSSSRGRGTATPRYRSSQGDPQNPRYSYPPRRETAHSFAQSTVKLPDDIIVSGDCYQGTCRGSPCWVTDAAPKDTWLVSASTIGENVLLCDSVSGRMPRLC